MRVDSRQLNIFIVNLLFEQDVN